MAARQPLELIILVRIQAPQPEFPAAKRFFRKWASRRDTGSAGSFLFYSPSRIFPCIE